jgi:hypothetical protein
MGGRGVLPSAASASGSVGIKSTRRSRTFDGRCVTTIVLTSPIRAARRTATSAENPARMLAPKKMPPSAMANEPTRLYQAKTRVRSPSGTTWESTDH